MGFPSVAFTLYKVLRSLIMDLIFAAALRSDLNYLFNEFLKMKEALAFIGILALAVSLWFLKEHTDKNIIDSKNEAILTLQNTVQSKEDLIVKNDALIDSGKTTIKSLQDAIQSKEDIIAKDNALIDSKSVTIKSLQDTFQTKDDIIAKDNAIISAYQERLAELSKNDDRDKDEDRDGQNVYPDDNGFDAQDLGSGFEAYQYFGKTIINPYNAPQPNRIPNHTPWTFSGNAGIAANNSGFYVNHATNRDSDGATSTSGQAGFLQFKGSSISQSVTLPAGTYTVTFDYEARRDYPANQIAVSIDKAVLFKGTPTECTNFKQITTMPISLTTSGKHELTFRGLGGFDNVTPGKHELMFPETEGIDATSGNPVVGDTFIDNVSINLVGSRANGADRHAFGPDGSDRLKEVRSDPLKK
jgi:uncharacterized protein